MGTIQFLDDRIKPEDPLRKVCAVKQVRRTRRILNDLQGMGCRVFKDETKEGHGWRIIVDGTSTDIPFPDGTSPFSPSVIDVRPNLVFWFTKTGTNGGTWKTGKVFLAGVDTTITNSPAVIAGVVATTLYWIKHDFAAATAVWYSGTTYPSPSDDYEIYRMLEITVGGGVITSFICPHPCDIHATAKST